MLGGANEKFVMGVICGRRGRVSGRFMMEVLSSPSQQCGRQMSVVQGCESVAVMLMSGERLLVEILYRHSSNFS